MVIDNMAVLAVAIWGSNGSVPQQVYIVGVSTFNVFY